MLIDFSVEQNIFDVSIKMYLNCCETLMQNKNGLVVSNLDILEAEYNVILHFRDISEITSKLNILKT